MTPHFRLTIIILTLIAIPLLSGCSNTLKVLEGADYACGLIHVESVTSPDTEADVRIGKIPDGWSPEDFLKVCSQ